MATVQRTLSGSNRLEKGEYGIIGRIAVFLCCLDDWVEIHKGLCSEVRPEATWVFELDFQFPYPAFGCIVVRRYRRISQKVEDVIPAFEQTIPERGELFVQIRQILVNKFVQTVKPRLCTQSASDFARVSLLAGVLQPIWTIAVLCQVRWDTDIHGADAPGKPDGWGSEARSMRCGGLWLRTSSPASLRTGLPVPVPCGFWRGIPKWNTPSALSRPSQVVYCSSSPTHRTRWFQTVAKPSSRDDDRQSSYTLPRGTKSQTPPTRT